MIIQRAYKTKLRLNDRQRTWALQCSGAARWCYNWGLEAMIKARENGRKTSVLAEKKRLNAIKDEVAPWLRDVPYVVLQGAFDNLDAAYKNFFRRVKAKDPKAGFPKFKSRKRGIMPFSLRGHLLVTATHIRLPRIGLVRLAEKGYLPVDDVRILSATVSESAGEWFVSLQVEQTIPDPEPATGPAIGVDLGLHTLAVFSNGVSFDNERPLKMALRKLRRLSREMSRRKEGGRNWTKTKNNLARMHAKVRSVRRHLLHEISSYAVARAKPQTIVLEDLNVRGMMARHTLAQAVGDVGMAELRRQIEYKAAWNGVRVMFADRFYPSSKKCSACGYIKADLRRSDRTYVCESCGVVLDRDLNAAINLAALAG